MFLQTGQSRENVAPRLLNKEEKTPKASRSQAFLPKTSAVPPATSTSRAVPPRPASRDSGVDAHRRSGCSDSVTACVQHTAEPSKSQCSAALLYKLHTLRRYVSVSESSVPTAPGK